MAVKVSQELCSGCGACEEECPVEAIRVVEGKAQVDEEECIECGVCIDYCPTDALKLD